MPIFQEIKNHLTARQVAEHYGLKVGRNGMACCPFHNDRTPSMKIDKGYYCFGCQAHGDAIGYVAQLHGLSQYDAACKIIEDFSLPIEIRSKDPVKMEHDRNKWKQEKEEREKLKRIKDHFSKWCSDSIDRLLKTERGIAYIKESFTSNDSEEVFLSKEFATAVDSEPLIGYWLDILCLGTENERFKLFMVNRKEVERYVGKVGEAVERRMAADRGYFEQRVQQCG